jgi:hypothetical protein
MFNNLSCINFNLQFLVSLQSNSICFTFSSPEHEEHFPCQYPILLLSVAIFLLFHSFILYNIILYTASYTKKF